MSNTRNEHENVIIEIRKTDIIAFLKFSKRNIFIGTVAGLVIGCFYAFSRPNEYTAQVSVMPEIQIKGGAGISGLGSIAGLTGIDINNLSSINDAVKPELYPNVLQSVPFALNISKKTVYSQELGRTELFETFIEVTNNSKWLNIFNRKKSDNVDTTLAHKINILQLTKQQESVTKYIADRITGVYDKKTGMLVVNSMMQDPFVAASTAQYALNYLTHYIVSYRTEKAKQEVIFLTKQVTSIKQRYQEAEYALSLYKDQNKSQYLNTAKIKEQRIQAEFLLSQELYSSLSKQLEMARIKVQQSTPVFKILEPVQVPTKKSGPKRTLIIIIAILLCLISSLSMSFFRYKR